MRSAIVLKSLQMHTKPWLFRLCQLELAVWLPSCPFAWAPGCQIFCPRYPEWQVFGVTFMISLDCDYLAMASPRWWNRWGSVLKSAANYCTLQVTSLRGALTPMESQVRNPRIAWPGCEWQWTAHKPPRNTEMKGSSWAGLWTGQESQHQFEVPQSVQLPNNAQLQLLP